MAESPGEFGKVDLPYRKADRHAAGGVREGSISAAGAEAQTTRDQDPAPSEEPSAGPLSRHPLRRIPIQPVAGGLFLAAVVWFLFVADTRADNDVVGGLRTLVDGLVALPGMVLDTEAYSAWWSYMSDQEGWGNIATSVREHVQLVAASMAAATAISVGLGVLLHRVRSLRSTVLGVASVFLTIPSLALFAVFISVPGIGVGDRGPIIALTLYSILPILRNTVTGLEQVDRAIIEAAKGVGLSPFQRLLRIELPLAWPVILTGIRVATLLNIGIAAIAPLVGGTGLGGYVRDGLQRFPEFTAVERMWTGVVATVVLALVVDLAFTLLRRATTSKGLRP